MSPPRSTASDVPTSGGSQSRILTFREAADRAVDRLRDVAAATAAALWDGNARARVKAEIVRLCQAGARLVEIHQADLARRMRCSLRTVERAFTDLRGARLLIEGAVRRLVPRLTEAGEWESSPKRWGLDLAAAWAALGCPSPTPDDLASRPIRPGRTVPSPLSGSIGNVDTSTVICPSEPVDNPRRPIPADARAAIDRLRGRRCAPTL